MRRILLFQVMLLLLLGMFNCTEKKGNKELYNEVMDIHDEVMPKMNDIYTLKRDLKRKISDNLQATESEKARIDSLIARLDTAGHHMMKWMHEFSPESDSVAGEENVKAYLEKEKEKIEKVREEMLGAISSAEKAK